MGEKIGNDEEIMPYITSANIACGFHAGDETSMRTTVQLAKRYGVVVGAHPSWRDTEDFGRREMFMPPEEVEVLIMDQILALARIAESEGVAMRHVKPHGALYNQAAKDAVLARAIAIAIKNFSDELILVGLAGSALIEAGIEVRLRVAREGFPDRNYNSDGTLVSRKLSDALIESPQDVALHAVELAQKGIEFAGRRVYVDTLCLHGDHPNAAQNAKSVREALLKAGIEIAAP
jgi:UPF0271 protein